MIVAEQNKEKDFWFVVNSSLANKENFTKEKVSSVIYKRNCYLSDITPMWYCRKYKKAVVLKVTVEEYDDPSRIEKQLLITAKCNQSTIKWKSEKS